MKQTLLPFLGYFARPFPKAEGFSAYRMPGLAVHGPVLIIAVFVGLWLSGPIGSARWLRPLLLAIYFLVGLYAGRDLAILAHYNGFILLGVWICFFTLVVAPQRVRAWTQASHITAHPLLLTSALLALFLLHVAHWSLRA